MDRALEAEGLEVKQEVDIWSMGCVYSEVSALSRVALTLLRYYVLVPMHAPGANGHTVPNSFYQIEIPPQIIPTDSEMCR